MEAEELELEGLFILKEDEVLVMPMKGYLTLPCSAIGSQVSLPKVCHPQKSTLT